MSLGLPFESPISEDRGATVRLWPRPRSSLPVTPTLDAPENPKRTCSPQVSPLARFSPHRRCSTRAPVPGPPFCLTYHRASLPLPPPRSSSTPPCQTPPPTAPKPDSSPVSAPPAPLFDSPGSAWPLSCYFDSHPLPVNPSLPHSLPHPVSACPLSTTLTQPPSASPAPPTNPFKPTPPLGSSSRPVPRLVSCQPLPLGEHRSARVFAENKRNASEGRWYR